MQNVIVARAYLVLGQKALVDARKHGNQLFGGKIKSGETIREGLFRELREELNLRDDLDAQLIAITERSKKNQRTIEVVFLIYMNERTAYEKRGKHNPRWIDISESGLRFGVNLE